MKRIEPSGDNVRFTGNLRHYHRSTVRAQKSWDDWVDGPAGSRPPSKNWFKIIGIAVGLLALTGTIVGLVFKFG
jgi:hypothetical protein